MQAPQIYNGPSETNDGVQMYQQTFVFHMPVSAGIDGVAPIANQQIQNMSNNVNPMLSAMFGGFGGAQPMQAGFDPIFQVLQASLNQAGRGNHRAASASGLESVVHLRIGNEENVECPISAETLEYGDWASRMPCGHYFAKESLMAWLESHNSCPVCRFELHTGKHARMRFSHRKT